MKSQTLPWGRALGRVSSSASLLPPGDQSLKAQNLRLKLIHINAAAKLESPDYRGPFLPAEMLSPAEPAGEKVTLLQSSLREALAGVLGSRENGRFDTRTIYGWQIGECVLSPPLWASSGTPSGSAWWRELNLRALVWLPGFIPLPPPILQPHTPLPPHRSCPVSSQSPPTTGL